MLNLDKNKKEIKRQHSPSSLRYVGLAFQMLGIIGIMSYIGFEMDTYLSNDTLVITAVGSLLGIFISFYQIFQDLLKSPD